MNTITKPTSVIFHTNGKIDPGTWELMGLSVKNTDSAIGMFGTGFKYAVAVLLRTGHEITVHCESGKVYQFGLEDMSFRGKDFQRVTCNGSPLAFTTHYGFKWKTDQAYRELASNTMDEGGLTFTGIGPIEGGTSIVITGADILESHANHDNIFIGEREPIASTRSVKFYAGKGDVWFRGVKIYELECAHFSYELLGHADLTEDRTLASQYALPYTIGSAICNQLEDKKLIEQLITSEGFEAGLDYDNTWSEEMEETVKKVWKDRPGSLNPKIQKILQRKSPSSGFAMKLITDDEQEMVDKAQDFLEKAGYKIECQVHRVESTDENLIAYYHGGAMHLTDKAFESGLFELVNTMFEEHCHHKGYHDSCRNFEQYLMKEVVRQAKKRLKATL